MHAKLTLGLCLCLAASAAPAGKRVMTMLATAHSQDGTTSAGTESRPGTVAADPDVLPLGTRIRLHDLRGRDLGAYLVTDTGAKVTGRHIDIYMPGPRVARRFGRRRVRVEVLKWGESKEQARAEDRADRIEGRGDQHDTRD